MTLLPLKLSLKEADLCSLDISCNSGRAPGPSWRLPTQHVSSTKPLKLPQVGNMLTNFAYATRKYLWWPGHLSTMPERAGVRSYFGWVDESSLAEGSKTGPQHLSKQSSGILAIPYTWWVQRRISKEKNVQMLEGITCIEYIWNTDHIR